MGVKVLVLDIDGTLTNIGRIAYKDRRSDDGTDTLAIQVQYGKAVTIGTIGTPDNPEFIYYSAPQNGQEKFQLYGNVKVFGDILFNSGATDSLNALKATVDSLVSRLSDLEQRVTDLENQI